MTAIRSIVAAAAFAAAGLSTAAFAEPKPPVTLAAVAIPATAPSIQSAPSASDDGRKICVKEVMTGSNAPRRQCHTRARWAELGIDMAAK